MKKLYLNYCVLLFLVLAGLSAMAQNRVTLSGTVLEAQSTPLAGATVVVIGTTLGGVADDEGQFSFQASLEAGEYQLKATYLSYAADV